MSANVKTGVWITNEIYEKINAGFLNYAAPGGDVDAIVDFTYWTWGGQNYGDAGNNCGGYFATSSPIQLPGSNWQCLAASSTNTYYAIKSDRTLWTWGSGGYGLLGLNSITDRSSPTQIPGTSWNCISGGTPTAGAIKTDGTLWMWGCNVDGRLGIGTNVGVAYSSPVQIPGTAWCHFDGGGYMSTALKTDGTLWLWGGGAAGSGLNNTISYSSPVQIPGTSWVESYGGGTVMARKTDNTLWAWGSNAGGDAANLGINSIACTYVSSPVQIPGTAWAEVYNPSPSQNTFARKTDGTLWAWGRNALGALGLNIVQSPTCCAVSSPAQIPGTNWCILTERAMDNGAGAIKSDGTLWIWGYSNFGRVPPGTTSSPIQVPGTSWWRLAGSNNETAHALKCP